MSAEPRRVTKSEAWTEWESQLVNGVFPLRRYLGGSDHSAVFLTEYKTENLSEVAIKFVPADTLDAEARLVQWGAVANLSHPHLVRLYDAGRCQFDGRDFIFVVMEHAEQTLAQILPQRALNPDEVREMLLPTLDALAFLHRNQLVQGQLKPSNFLVINDQLKLASDTARPIGDLRSGLVRTSVYDAPELKEGRILPAGDIWGLGMTLIEALTQRTPAWTDDRSETAALVAALPTPFADTAWRCLNLAPADRPTVAQLETQYNPAPPARLIAIPQPPAPEPPRKVTPAQKSPSRALLLPVAAALLIAIGTWFGLRQSSTPGDSQPDLQAASAPAAPAAHAAEPTPAVPTVSASAPSLAPAAFVRPAAHSSALAENAPAPQQPTSLPPEDSHSVLHEVMPDVPRAIREKIRGRIHVRVRVLVDPAGNVVGQFMENPGPSRYFARLGGAAAGEWKFAPAEGGDSRVWMLHFEFNRGGVNANATAAR